MNHSRSVGYYRYASSLAQVADPPSLGTPARRELRPQMFSSCFLPLGMKFGFSAKMRCHSSAASLSKHLVHAICPFFNSLKEAKGWCDLAVKSRLQSVRLSRSLGHRVRMAWALLDQHPVLSMVVAQDVSHCFGRSGDCSFSALRTDSCRGLTTGIPVTLHGLLNDVGC